MDCSLPGSSVHGVFQAGVLEWGAIAFSEEIALQRKMPDSDGLSFYAGLIPGPGRSLGGGCGNPFQYSCLENPMDGGAWQAPVHGVTKSQT